MCDVVIVDYSCDTVPRYSLVAGVSCSYMAGMASSIECAKCIQHYFTGSKITRYNIYIVVHIIYVRQK